MLDKNIVFFIWYITLFSLVSILIYLSWEIQIAILFIIAIIIYNKYPNFIEFFSKKIAIKILNYFIISRYTRN